MNNRLKDKMNSINKTNNMMKLIVKTNKCNKQLILQKSKTKYSRTKIIKMINQLHYKDN